VSGFQARILAIVLGTCCDDESARPKERALETRWGRSESSEAKEVHFNDGLANLDSLAREAGRISLSGSSGTQFPSSAMSRIGDVATDGSCTFYILGLNSHVVG
jgi:hypothetical protein